MSLSSLPQSYTLEQSFDGLIVTIHRPRSISIALAAWTLMWVVLLPVLGYFIMTNATKASTTSLLIVALIFVIVLIRVYPALYLLARQIAGQEQLEITPQSITAHTQIFGIKRAREYEAENIAGIRVDSPGTTSFSFLRFGLASFEVQSTGPIILVLSLI